MHVFVYVYRYLSKRVCVTQSCLTLCDPMAIAYQAPLSTGFFGKNIGVICHFLLQFK